MCSPGSTSRGIRSAGSFSTSRAGARTRKHTHCWRVVGMGICAPYTYSIVGFLISVVYFHKFVLSSYACLRQYTEFTTICIFIHGNVHIKHAPTRESSGMHIIYTEIDRKHIHPHGNRDTFTVGGVCLGVCGCEFPCRWGVGCVLV